LALSLIDTSDYTAGKRYWWVNKRFYELSRDPNVVPQQEFEDIIDSYTNIITDYPDSELIPSIKFQIGKLLTLQGKYKRARNIFEDIIKVYEDKHQLCTEALLYIGMAYEKEQREEEAIKVYKKIMALYPTTDIGLRMPLLIVQYYARAKKLREEKKAYQEAVDFYYETHKNNRDNIIGYRALNILSRAYLDQKEWQKAIDILADMLMQYAPTKIIHYREAYNLIKIINNVALSELKDYDKPKAIYQRFLEQNPQHPLKSILSEMIMTINDLNGQKNISSELADVTTK